MDKNDECILCGRKVDLITCKCGYTYCKWHYSFHVNNTCSQRSKKGKKESNNDDL